MSKKPFIALLIMGLSFISAGHPSASQNQIKAAKEIAETPIKAELIWSVGSDKENENFYGPQSFAVDAEGRVFVLDTKNSRVQCFSKDGKFLFSFARYGKGPGELSKQAEWIKILEDDHLYIIEGFPAQIIAYDRNGKYLRSWRTKESYNDIELINGKYYLSNCLMQEDNKPIHVMNEKGEIEASFGIILEPQKGILARIVKEKEPTLKTSFNNSSLSRLMKNKKSELFYSLRVPYRFIKYDSSGRVIKDIAGEMDYGGTEMFFIEYQEGVPVMRMSRRGLPIIFPPQFMKDGSYLVPFLKKERDFLYFDHYDSNDILNARYKIPTRITQTGESIADLKIDAEGNLYCLIDSLENPARIEKFRLQGLSTGK